LASIRLRIYLFGLRTANKISGTIAGDGRARLVSFILIRLYIKKITKKYRVDMVCTLIYYYSAPEGKYLEPATSSHPIEAEGYEIRPVSYPWSES
jgi:hypothetical protein